MQIIKKIERFSFGFNELEIFFQFCGKCSEENEGSEIKFAKIHFGFLSGNLKILQFKA